MQTLQQRDHLATNPDNLTLVDAIARRFATRLPPSFDFDDLRGAGYLGLLDAATRYEPERGVPFRAFAGPRIRGAIRDSIRRRRYRDQTHDELEQAADRAAPCELEERTAAHERAKVVSIAVGRLPDRERALVGAHYGADRSLGEIGATLGVGPSRASQLHRDALKRLQRDLATAGLREAA